MDSSPTSGPGAQALGEELVGRYTRIRMLTAAAYTALEQDDTSTLDVVFYERARELDRSEALIRQLAAQNAALPDVLQQAAETEVRAIQELDRRLQVLLSSGTQEVPAQLAQIRGSLSKLGGYHGGQPDRPEIVDRRG